MTTDVQKQEEILKLHSTSKYSLREIADMVSVSHNTVRNIVNSSYDSGSIELSIYDGEIVNRVRDILNRRQSIYNRFEKLLAKIEDGDSLKKIDQSRKLLKNMNQSLYENSEIFARFGGKIVLAFEKKLELEKFNQKDYKTAIIKDIADKICRKCKDKLIDDFTEKDGGGRPCGTSREIPED